MVRGSKGTAKLMSASSEGVNFLKDRIKASAERDRVELFKEEGNQLPQR